jgi:nucleotide-binding universal stress UspA family protein
MSYGSLLVHVEPNEAGRERLHVAVQWARLFGARLIGVGARAENAMPDPIGISIVKLKQEIEKELSSAKSLFDEVARTLGPDSKLWRAEVDFPTQSLLRHASGADLILSGCWVHGAAVEKQACTADLIMAAGIPVLAVPAGAMPDFTRIAIGWKDTREARRAVWDALPLLKRAQHVQLLELASGAGTRSSSVTDVIERLRRHGVHAQAETRGSTESSVAEDMLKAAQDVGAGLIVVGGYGHSRLREWVLGGMTQGLLTKSSKCVLFSH